MLHRTTRRVQLTQDGLVYYDRCLDLLSMLDDMLVAMATGFILQPLPEFL